VEGAMHQVVELNSLSKSHNMAGWRVGMLCGNKKFIDDVLRFKSNMDSGMFLPSQLAAAKALSLPTEWYREQNLVYEQRKIAATKILKLLNCKVSDKQAGLFIWAEVGKDFEDGFKLSDHILYEANVFITPGGIFGSAGNKYVRISLCSSETTLAQAYKNIENLLKK
jgi:aspartate/methionine/tyrosine aminotransferase